MIVTDVGQPDTAESLIPDPRPFVIGIGGTMRPNSNTEIAIRSSLAATERMGAATAFYGARDLEFSMYSPAGQTQPQAVRRFLEDARRADGVIIGTPGYHGGISGLIKNALDYLEELRDDERPYLDGRAVGCVVCAQGWQATVTTLASLRSVVHALRGWPTPLGVALNSADHVFEDGEVVDSGVATQLEVMGRQIVAFATAHSRASWLVETKAVRP
jgi:FMN reductase